MAENKMRVGIKYRVTKGNSDGSIIAGDIIMLDKDGDIVCDKTGWMEKDQLTPDVMDFEVYEVEEADKNKMEQVAQLFGKKLNEPFKVMYLGEIITMEFTEDGLISSDLIYKGAIIEFNKWHVLMTGYAVIVDDGTSNDNK